MKIVDKSIIAEKFFNPIYINALRQYWKNSKSFQCIGSPKGQNLLLYLDGCRISYTDKSGEGFEAVSGEVVYTPVGSEYRAILSDFSSPESHTVGVNFLLLDELGEGIILSDKITVFRPKDSALVASLFDRAAAVDGSSQMLSKRIILLEILSELASEYASSDSSLVELAIRHISENIEKNLSIAELSRLCKVSDVYLRKKFKESVGISPVKYRNELRLERASSYLRFGDISVQEISDMLGYSTVSHFIKEFKAKYGISPLKYRKSESGK